MLFVSPHYERTRRAPRSAPPSNSSLAAIIRAALDDLSSLAGDITPDGNRICTFVGKRIHIAFDRNGLVNVEDLLVLISFWNC
jgi:hypothetical protein